MTTTQPQPRLINGHPLDLSDLHPQLIGLEGYRVEVTDADNTTYRFQVGRSTGWRPCHIALSRRTAYGGPAVDSRPFKRVTTLYKVQ